MNTQTLKDGDPFEREKAVWIRSHFPDYEVTWSKYIGNDGTSEALNLRGLTPEQEKYRALFRQCHYSLALFTYLFEGHSKRAIENLRKAIAEERHQTLGAYFGYTADFTLYVALLGQICDMVEQIGPPGKKREISALTEAFMKQRNNAIHAARIPMGWDCYGVTIAKIAGLVADEGKWAKFVPWGEMSREDFQYLDTWMEETSNSLMETLREFVSPAVARAANNYFGPAQAVCPVPRPSDQKAGFSGHAGSASGESIKWKVPPSGGRDPR